MTAAPEARDTDIVVTGGLVVTMDTERRLIRDGAVAVKDGAIAGVGKAAQIARDFTAAETIDARGKLVLPGLIDGHNHPVHFLSKGFIDDMKFPERWRERVWPYEIGLSDEEAQLAATGTFLEMIRHGTTCFADPGTFQPDAIAAAAGAVGIRGVIARLTSDVEDPEAPAHYTSDTETAVGLAEAVVDKWHGAHEGRLRAWFSLVRTGHVTDDLCQRVKARADALGVGIHAHLATTAGEVKATHEQHGVGPVERFRRIGVLGRNAYLVHMGWIEEADIAVLKQHDVSVCHCPSASMFGGFGCIAHGKFPELVDAGVRVVLGTDACAVSRFLDMVRVMYLAACAHKDVTTDPTVIGAHKALEMATADAARALLWDGPDGIGCLTAGKRADLIVVDMDDIAWQPNPELNPVGNLVYSGTGEAVRTVLIDGRVVMRDRIFETIDETMFRRDAAATSTRILDRLGITLAPRWPIA
ncbi:MAG: amidohydrolase family protein [Proteobacteria bacterium]|nr:amidohydrolase family protein [Pseudomonadota bacterium]